MGYEDSRPIATGVVDLQLYELRQRVAAALSPAPAALAALRSHPETRDLAVQLSGIITDVETIVGDCLDAGTPG